MRWLSFFIGFACLTGCDTGTRNYWGIAPERVSAQGMTFDVRVNGLMAEALRQNFMTYPRFEDVARAASEAMTLVSGCRVLQTRGDPSVVEGRLDCAGQKAPAFRKKPQTAICRVESFDKNPERPEDYLLFCD